MTTKQELKIKIREVNLEKRHLTVEEWAVYLLSENGNSIYQHYAEDIVKSWGLIEFENGLIGLFRTETIRDATPDEVVAWHILAVDKACWNHECEICNIGKVYSCLYCNCDSNEANNARELLKDKEVILELVD